MVRINEVEIKDRSWRLQDVEVLRRTGTSENGMEVIMNKEDGYINGTLLAEQVSIFLLQEMKDECIQEDIEHLKLLTGQKAIYHGDSSYNKEKGVYVHPFLALQLLAVLKHRDNDYEEYYNFLKETIFEFLSSDNKFSDVYKLVDMFHGE